MLKIGDLVKMSDGLYEVIKVTESRARIKCICPKIVEFETRWGVKVNIKKHKELDISPNTPKYIGGHNDNRRKTKG